MRMWEIKEKSRRDSDKYEDYRGSMGMREKSVDEAYECGYEDGYEAALKEMDERSMRSGSYRESSSYRMRSR